MADMKLVGSRFTSISANRELKFDGKLTMKTNITVGVVEKIKGSKDTVEVPFSFGIDYKDLGKIKIDGVLYIRGSSKVLKELMRISKEKDLDAPEYMAITNIILQKSSVKALELEEELGLPFHIRLPSLTPKE